MIWFKLIFFGLSEVVLVLLICACGASFEYIDQFSGVDFDGTWLSAWHDSIFHAEEVGLLLLIVVLFLLLLALPVIIFRKG
jgi:hypothetical protein